MANIHQSFQPKNPLLHLSVTGLRDAEVSREYLPRNHHRTTVAILLVELYCLNGSQKKSLVPGRQINSTHLEFCFLNV